MSNYVIFTDSCADMDPRMVEALGLTVLPLSYTMGGNTYFNHYDNREMSSTEFYDKMRGGEVSTTSAVNVDEFIQKMEPVLEGGQDILVLTFSAALSCTNQSAVLAAEDMGEKYPQRTVRVVDTFSASAGQALLLVLANRRREAGASLEEVATWVEENRDHMAVQFTVESLEYLKRGGRISTASAVVGTMLAVKPVLHINEEGKLVPLCKVRGRQTSIRTLVDGLDKATGPNQRDLVFLTHADCLEEAEKLAETLRTTLGVQEVCISDIGPVIGSHAGPGTLALGYMREN